MSPGASARLAAFVRFLRHHGYGPGPAETADALRALEHGGTDDVAVGRQRLRSLFCRDHEEWRRFPALFDRFWLGIGEGELRDAAAAGVDVRLRRSEGPAATGLAGTADDLAFEPGCAGAGRQVTLSRADFRFLTDARDRREIERLAERLARSLRHRHTRRRAIRRHGHRLDLRHTLRASLRTGGLPVHPRYRARQPRTPRLLLLQDISHSMVHYSPLLTRFCRGLLRAVRDAEAFAFHTRLYRVTELYRERDAAELKRRMESMNHLWLGGTRIAESLGQFNRQHAERALRPQTVCLLMSDGFDSDDSGRLAEEVAALRARCRRLLWLNPALGLPGITVQDLPAEVRRRVDLVLPAHNLMELSRAVRSLAAD